MRFLLIKVVVQVVGSDFYIYFWVNLKLRINFRRLRLVHEIVIDKDVISSVTLVDLFGLFVAWKVVFGLPT